LSVEVERGIRVPAADGAALATDLYLAEGAARGPSLLARTPYDRTRLEPQARWFAERGYSVVVQDVRGRFESEGSPDFFAEASDGRATADWIAAADWSDGAIGTFGGSYLSFTQWALASTFPPQLRAMCISIYGSKRKTAWYPGGALALELILSWTYEQVRGREAMEDRARSAAELAAGFDALPLGGADLAAIGETVPQFQDWLEHSDPADEFWRPLDYSEILPQLGVPVLLIDGWFDFTLPYLLEDKAALDTGGAPVRLVIGPWAHNLVDQTRSNLEALGWFERHLKEQPHDTSTAKVTVFVMPDVGWTDLDEWPPSGPASEERVWHLHPAGALLGEAPPLSAPDSYTYEPIEPTPSVGGTQLTTYEPQQDNRDLEARGDVLSYTTPRFESDVHLVGDVAVTLNVRTSNEHIDFFARLCEVYPDERSINICDGLLRLRPGDVAAAEDGRKVVQVDLWPTAYRVAAGQCLRLQISGGAHPRWARNMGTGEPLQSAARGERSLVEVFHEPGFESYLKATVWRRDLP
jgi:putative CocE/NonD family hydrolase